MPSRRGRLRRPAGERRVRFLPEAGAGLSVYARAAGLTLMMVLFFAKSTGAVVPSWVGEEIHAPVRKTEGEKGATILRVENIITVTEDGAWQRLYRFAIRIERPDAAGFAEINFPFLEKADEIERADAWLLRDGKVVKSYPRKEWLDRAQVDDATLYSDFRDLLVKCPLASQGDVFAGEVAVRQSANFGQQQIAFSWPVPVQMQRLEIRAPMGWTEKLFWLNGGGCEPRIRASQNVSVWEIHDQPEERQELWAPTEPLLRAALMVAPPAVKSGSVPSVPSSWQEVAATLASIQQAQCDSNAELVQVTQRLTAGLNDPWKKIQALTTLVQNLRYIAVNRNSGLGFGYCPSKATAVLAADYGDCKDKANLLKALLRVAGFRAHLVAAYAGDQQAVRPEWPSAMQFNHAIVAIELPADLVSSMAVEDPTFGRLLFFDATARWIPVGHLPWILEGGWGLVCDPRSTGLVRFPQGSLADELKVSTQVQLTLDQGGGCRGEATETTEGQLAALMREVENSASEQQQLTMWTRRLSGSMGGALVQKIVSQTAPELWQHTTKIKFTAASFARPFRNGMQLFNLDLLRSDATPALPDKPRQHDLLIQPIWAEREVELDVPPGSQAEIPAPKELQSVYGQYRGTYDQVGQRIIYRRSLKLAPGRVTPEKYQEYRKFLGEVAKAERTALIVHQTEGQADPTPSP